MAAQLMTTDDVARRLGVKRETVYAYVSRGLLERHPSSAARDSRFARDAVERLAGSARRPDRSRALEVTVDTQLTEIDPAGRLRYRGHDAVELARFRSFEQTAALLWDGDVPAPWVLDGPSAELIAAVRAALPADARPGDRIAVAVAALATLDPELGDRRPEAVRRSGVRMVAGALDLLAPDGPPAGDRSVAARTWAALTTSDRGPRPAQRAAIDAALVLLADHELAASTLAARVAASAWADPYRVALAGLGPLGGSLHGASPVAVEQLLAAIPTPRHAFDVLQARVASGGGVPGFGHLVYRDRDPRADHLLARMRAAADDDAAVATTMALVEAAAALGLPAPNVDLALGGLVRALRLRPGSSAAVFALARLAGILAHAMEEYPHRLRFRPRATYVGDAPR